MTSRFAETAARDIGSIATCVPSSVSYGSTVKSYSTGPAARLSPSARCRIAEPSTPTKGLGIADWDRSLVIFLEPDLNVARARVSTGASLDTGRVKRRSVSTIAAF
jgi:hypothetical protein